MLPQLPWNTVAPAMPREDADMLLQEFKSFRVEKNDPGHCHICMISTPHAMIIQRVRCSSTECGKHRLHAACPWRGRVMSCTLLGLMTVEGAYAHATCVREPRKPTLTPAMKEVVWDWAAQGLKPKRIWDVLLQRFNLDEASTPAIPTLQLFVYYHVTGRLGGSDLLSVLRSTIEDTAFTGQEEEASAFTLTLRTDGEGQPLMGNGSDANPFVLGISTKKLLRQADRDPAFFILHLDATYKLTQVVYPVIVVGLSDRVRRFHPLAIFIVSQQQQSQYTEVLALLRRTYTAITGNPLRVQFVIGDADAAQWNAVQDVFGSDTDLRFLMYSFHVAKKVYEKTRSLTPRIAAFAMTDIHDLHFAVSEMEFHGKLVEFQAKWAQWPQLTTFSAYSTKVWLNQMVWRWQCFHTPSGFATTCNPCETYNVANKRNVTLRRKLKVGVLIGQVLKHVKSKVCGLDRSRWIHRQMRASFVAPSQCSVRACCWSDQLHAPVLHFCLKERLPMTRSTSCASRASSACIFDEVLRTTAEDMPISAQLTRLAAEMERRRMPTNGWPVNVVSRACPCRFWLKFGCCVLVLFAPTMRGGMDLSGRDTLVYCGGRGRQRESTRSQPTGYPTNNGQALAMD